MQIGLELSKLEFVEREEWTVSLLVENEIVREESEETRQINNKVFTGEATCERKTKHPIFDEGFQFPFFENDVVITTSFTATSSTEPMKSYSHQFQLHQTDIKTLITSSKTTPFHLTNTDGINIGPRKTYS